MTSRIEQRFKFRITSAVPSLLTLRAQLFALRVVPFLLSPARTRSATRFVICAAARTGSDLLVDLLNCHPEIHCDSEILSHRLFVLSPRSLPDGRSARFARSVYGFKLKLVHLHAQRIEHPARFLAGLHEGGWRIIHLRRRNLLRAIISSDVAMRRGALHHRVSEGPLGPVRLRVDAHQILERVARREASLAAEERALADLPRLTMWYEDDLLRADRHQPTGEAVFAYLGLAPVQVRTQHVRLTPDHLSEVLENYDEIVQVFGATRYAGLLAEA